jgi:serine protease Do
MLRFALLGLALGLARQDASEPAHDRIVTRSGAALTGTIVKETAEWIFLDVGHTILSFPRAEVAELTRAAEDAAAPETQKPVGDELYTTIDRAEASVRENVERVAEGVVLVRVPGALGSGLVISAEGHVSVTIFRRRERDFGKEVFEDVRILAVNPYWDLALLKLPPERLGSFPLTVVPFGDMDRVQAGDGVFAVGNPLGLERSVSEGIVSTKNRASDGMLYVQTTAATNPGNSGGPLLNLRGEMIGVLTWGFLGMEGLNFAIPVSTVQTFLENRDAFAFDKEQDKAGFHYLRPPRKGARPE